MVTRLETARPLRVLIVGGASGVGFACAVALADYGAELILCDIDGDALTCAADQLGAFTRYCDAIDANSVAIFEAEVAEKFPSIDVLINAAGRGYVRALGMMRMACAFMPLLRLGGGRRLLINVAPSGGSASGDGMFPYSGSHRSFHGLSDSIKEQVRGTAIEVVCLSPRLRRGESNDCGVKDGPYRLERVDEDEAAKRVIQLIEATREIGSRRRLPQRRRTSRPD